MIEKTFKNTVIKLILILLISSNVLAQNVFPDGTQISEWFLETKPTNIHNLGKQYNLKDYDVVIDSTKVQTQIIQAVIDKAYNNGGGVIIVPKGTFLSGALYFKQGTHLHLEKGAVLKGSDDISDFPVVMTRMEGQTLKYFPALVNADNNNGFTLSGEGMLNGNGLRYWKAFWLRREFNPKCTNMDEMRPRLLYVSNSKNVQISGVRLKDSPYWTTHFYKCEYVKLLNLTITSPEKPVLAPSTDAIDIDACQNFLVKNCYMSVNDDAISLKGGKGPHADKDPNNGGNRNILIEDNTYGYCHSALTCGSESINNYNIFFRNSTVNRSYRIFWLKMRPDTPQKYEYIHIENIKGKAVQLLQIKPWTQFFDLKGGDDIIKSYASNISLKDISLKCSSGFRIEQSDQYHLSNFTFEDITLETEHGFLENTKYIEDVVLKNITVK